MRVRWTRPSLNDLGEIQDFIAQHSLVAAHRPVKDLIKRIEHGLGSAPALGRPGRVPRTRELVFADLPYIVVYRTRVDVEILAVVHTARKWPEAFD